MTASETGTASETRASAATEAAAAYFRAKLQFETAASDVASALATGEPGFVLIDTRTRAAWDQGHVVGALHLPRAKMEERIRDEVPTGTPVVVYCWGPVCSDATKSALLLSTMGYPVKEMIGGFEYWAREGCAVERADGTIDPLTAVRVPGIACDR